MIIPKYWAEAKRKETINGSSTTITRFGWSDVDEADAKTHAEERVEAAMAEARSGKGVHKRDRKVAYNGADGLPIREEIVSNHEGAVITRNAYGALCLNTPDVFFADIDFEPNHRTGDAVILKAMICAPVAAVVAYGISSLAFFLLSLAIITPLIFFIEKRKADKCSTERQEKQVLETLHALVKDNPKEKFDVFRTPNGMRVLALHKPFAPDSQQALDLLNALNSDAQYIQMCRNQKCFRARVSPKPWRIEMRRIKPRSNIWPIDQSKMPEREKWVKEYNQKSQDFASCRHIETIGNEAAHPKALKIKKLHEQLCKSNKTLPIA